MFHKQALCKLAELKPKIEENRRIHAPRFKLDKIGDFTTKGERRQVAKPVEILIDKLLQQRCFEEEGIFFYFNFLYTEYRVFLIKITRIMMSDVIVDVDA